MGYAEDIIKLRQRVSDAMTKGLIDGGKNFLEASLIQIMNDAEMNRQNCLTNAENLRRQAATLEGQAGAFASVTSIIYNVINGYVLAAEKEAAQQAELDKEALSSSENKDSSYTALSLNTTGNLRVELKSDKKTRKTKP